jgi:hypothetical protein
MLDGAVVPGVGRATGAAVTALVGVETPSVHWPHDEHTADTASPVVASTSGAPVTPQKAPLLPPDAYVVQSPNPASNTPAFKHIGRAPAGAAEIGAKVTEFGADVGPAEDSPNGLAVGANDPPSKLVGAAEPCVGADVSSPPTGAPVTPVADVVGGVVGTNVCPSPNVGATVDGCCVPGRTGAWVVGAPAPHKRHSAQTLETLKPVVESTSVRQNPLLSPFVAYVEQPPNSEL